MNIKKNLILNTALKLFYQSGIHAVGINEILKHAGTSKKTMYFHFKSKEGLIVETLKLRNENFISWLNSKIIESTCGKRNIINIFLGLDAWFNNRENKLGNFRGCFFINASAEYSQPDSKIFEVCQQHKQSVKDIIREQVKKFSCDDVETERITDIISIIKEGCISSALVQGEKDSAIKALSTIESIISITAK
jgi:AcrR family transcriptional regulator